MTSQPTTTVMGVMVECTTRGALRMLLLLLGE